MIYNNKNLDVKVLNLEIIKDLTTDEIINLFRQGYILEPHTNIETLQTYNEVCFGTPTLDINWSSVSQQGGAYLYKEVARAYKINPTSRCLDFATFYGIRRVANVNLYVEIRQDDGTGNKPLGTPDSSTGRLAQVLVPYSNIPTSFGTFNVDLGLILPSVGTYWLILRSADYSCSNVYTQRLELSFHWLNENRRIVYGYSDVQCNPAGCCWYGLNIDVIPMSIYRKTYTPQVLTNILVTPTTVSINTGATTQLTFTCKDQNNNTISCPTLSWSSSNTSAATVSQTGLVTGISTGTTNITASAGGVTSNISTITVSGTSSLASIYISPTTLSIGIGNTRQLTVKCRNQNNNIITCPTLIWESDHSSIAIVNQTGLVTGLSTGTANIIARYGDMTSNVSTITISEVPPSTGGMLAIVAVAGLGFAYLMMRKSSPPQ